MQYSTMRLSKEDVIILRTMLNLSQSNVSFLINKHRSYVGHLETGRVPITAKVDADLKRAFALTPEVHEAVRIIADRLRELEK